MIDFEHDKTLIVGRVETDARHAASIPMALHQPVRRVEWMCPCGASGPGFPPEQHASGACEATRGFQQWECVPCGVRGVGPMPDEHGTMACVSRIQGFVDGGGI